MIRILQQNNRFTKVLFALIIGAAVITMVITLVPGIFDNASGSDVNAFATVHEPGIFGRFVDGTTIKIESRRAGAPLYEPGSRRYCGLAPGSLPNVFRRA